MIYDMYPTWWRAEALPEKPPGILALGFIELCRLLMLPSRLLLGAFGALFVVFINGVDGELIPTKAELSAYLKWVFLGRDSK